VPLEFGVLGPLMVWADGEPLAVSGAKRRGVLAYLLAHAGEPQPLDRIVDALWGDSASSGAESTVQTYISQLRKLFGSDGPQLVHRAGGYVIDVDPAALDARRFEAAVAAASVVDERDGRIDLLDEALRWWRGVPFDEFAGQAWADERARQWTRMHVLAHQLREAALLATGRHREALPTLEKLVSTYPLHEPFWSELILARYRCGNPADALAAVSEARMVLATELGIEPGAEIIELERKILCQDSSLEIETDNQNAPHEGRMTTVVEPLPTGVVTFLLTDIEGSTELWDLQAPNMSRALLAHEDVIANVVESHNGRLLKSRGEGDATLSVFAAATDAVSAALGLQSELHDTAWPGDLEIRTRIALHSGEAQARNGDYYGGTLNRAARIRGLAVGGQLLVSRATHDLVADQIGEEIVVRELGTHELKGLRRSETVFSLRHRSFPEIAVTRPTLVPAEPRHGHKAIAPPGRGSELARLTSICSDVLPNQPGRVVLVEGEPGVGVSTVLNALEASFLDAALTPEIIAIAAHGDGAHSLRSLFDDGSEPTRLPEVAEHDRMIGVMSERAKGRGLLVLVDDADELDHWSVGLILAMAQHPPVGTVVIVGSPSLTRVARDVGTGLALVPGAQYGSELHLGRLDEDALREVVRQQWPDADSSVQWKWAAHLKSWCDGHPLLVKHALSTAAATDDPSAAAVPTSVEVLARRQLDELPDGCDRYLEMAAELGGAIDLALIAEICGEQPASIAAALAPAIESGIVRRATRKGHWEFDHGLIRDVVRRRVAPSDALRWHAAAGTALRDRGGREAEVARHLAAAVPLVDAEVARAAAMDAGALLLASGAYQEAAERFREAADLGADISDRAAALIGVGRALECVGERLAAETAFDEATRLATTIGSTDLLARAAIGGTAHSSAVRGRSGRRWRLQQAWSQLPRDADGYSEVVAELALELLNGGHAWPKSLDDEVRSIANTEGSPARVLAMRVVVAEDEALRGATTHDAGALVELALVSSDIPEHWASAALAVGIGVAVASGEWDEAAGWIDELAGFGARTGEPRARWQSLVYRAVLAEGRGDSRLADTTAAEALTVGDRLEMLDAPATFALQHIGRAYRQGSLAHLVDSLASVDDRYRVPIWDSLRAAATLDTGDESAAASLLDNAVHQLRVATGRVDHYRVAAVAIASRVAARMRHIDVALELAAELDARRGRFVVLGYGGPCLGPVDCHLADVMAASGHDTEATALLADARALCRRASASAWLNVVGS
jgi:class 3 adenylate cyclase